jgi:hypothetical protein
MAKGATDLSATGADASSMTSVAASIIVRMTGVWICMR